MHVTARTEYALRALLALAAADPAALTSAVLAETQGKFVPVRDSLGR